jgi:glycosyltransferase involved in cell wall biosynthesis
LFVSPRFLFPVDSGGKIRTTQILRGLKGGVYSITLSSPASAEQRAQHAAELQTICDRFVSWTPRSRIGSKVARAAAFFSALPVPVATDRSAAGKQLVRRELAAGYDVAVFDFPHAAVLAPNAIDAASVLFTHNVEAEIFRRHAEVSTGALAALWRGQLRKMTEFEREALHRFDAIVAVSERDAQAFSRDYGVTGAKVIGTGVDLDYFAYAPPDSSDRIVFSGSMDWLANRDGIAFFMDEIWPLVVKEVPAATMTVVGRDPPPALVRRAGAHHWRFTGYVDDVRTYVRAASAYVIPLRVGGGTRLKVYEAMAMGCPIVSTSVGIEGLPVAAGQHYLRADGPAEFAAAIIALLRDEQLRARLSIAARRFVEDNCSYQAVARQFESICDAAARRAR